jgi:uncharacterized protein (TIGR03000 family)
VVPAVPGTTALRTTRPFESPAVPATTTTPAPENLLGTASGGEAARVIVRVPEDAQLEFQGVNVPGTGRVRKFWSPPLAFNQTYTYNVRARWAEDGQEVTRDRQVSVAAGERVDIDFLSEVPAPERKLRTEPLPPPAASGAPGVPGAESPAANRQPLTPTLPPARP